MIILNILITGAKSNIGYNLAKKLSLRGHIVYACCKTLLEKEMLDKKIKEEKIIMFPIVLNLLDNDFSFIEDLSIDAIILHASICNGGSLLEISNKRIKESIDTNILGNIKLLKTYLNYCYNNKRKGKIFITSSLAAFYPMPYLSSYNTSKLYLVSLANTLRFEVKYQKIDVSISLILPGAYHTGFNDLMIENKSLDNYLIKDKAIKMSFYQKIFFSFMEKIDYNDLIYYVVRELEKEKPKFIISRPISQKIFTKLYMIFTFLVV